MEKSEEYGFLTLSPAQTIQQTLKQLECAFKDAFDKNQPLKRMPTFKKKGEVSSFSFPQGFKIDKNGKRIFLPKIGWVNVRKNQAILGKAKNVTVSQKGKHWFVSIQVEQEVAPPKHPSNTMIGALNILARGHRVLACGEIDISQLVEAGLAL